MLSSLLPCTTALAAAAFARAGRASAAVRHKSPRFSAPQLPMPLSGADYGSRTAQLIAKHGFPQVGCLVELPRNKEGLQPKIAHHCP